MNSTVSLAPRLQTSAAAPSSVAQLSLWRLISEHTQLRPHPDRSPCPETPSAVRPSACPRTTPDTCKGPCPGASRRGNAACCLWASGACRTSAPRPFAAWPSPYPLFPDPLVPTRCSAKTDKIMYTVNHDNKPNVSL